MLSTNVTPKTIRFVLSVIPVYLLIAMNVPKWVLQTIDKIRRALGLMVAVACRMGKSDKTN